MTGGTDVTLLFDVAVAGDTSVNLNCCGHWCQLEARSSCEHIMPPLPTLQSASLAYHHCRPNPLILFLLRSAWLYLSLGRKRDYTFKSAWLLNPCLPPGGVEKGSSSIPAANRLSIIFEKRCSKDPQIVNNKPSDPKLLQLLQILLFLHRWLHVSPIRQRGMKCPPNRHLLLYWACRLLSRFRVWLSVLYFYCFLFIIPLH